MNIVEYNMPRTMTVNMLGNISSQTKSETLAETQKMFTSHIRDPENQPIPNGIEDRRMKVYRDSIFLNKERVVANFFPVIKKILTEDHWLDMIKDYLKYHRAHLPPYLPRLGQEFLSYLEHERDLSDDPDFILELAHYEWIEFALSIDQREIDYDGIDPEGDLLNGIPVMSQLAQPLCYQYPVHTIDSEHQPEEVPSELTYLVVCRDHNYEMSFIELNPVSARLLEKIQEKNNKTGEVILDEIGQELNQVDSEVVRISGFEILRRMLARDVILGIQKN